MLFVILGLETLLIIILASKIKDFTIHDNKMNLRIFWEKAKDKKHLKDIYKCMFFRRISSQGAITELLPIVLFLRLGFISSIFVVFNASFATLVIYYILMNSFGIIIESESCSAVYAAIKTDNLEEYRKEHIMTFNIYMFVGQLISYSLVYILYNYFYNVNILSITIAILMFFLIIATIYLRKTEDYLYKNRTQN